MLHSYIAADINSSVSHDFRDNNNNKEDLDLNVSSEDINNLANEFKRTSWKRRQQQQQDNVDNRRKRYWTPKNDDNSLRDGNNMFNINGNTGNARHRIGNYTVTEFYKVDSLKIHKNSYDDAFDSQSYLRLCGAHEASLSKYNFISRNNEIYLHFHSDFSVSGTGYALTWNAVDVSGCPIQTLTAHEGFINSPNYPHFLLNNLDCTYIIQAPHGKRVLIEFSDFQIVSGAEVKIDIGDELFNPFGLKRQLNDGVYVTKGEKLIIRLQTGEQPRGIGFRAIYKTSEFGFI